MMTPTEIRFHKQTQILSITFDDNTQFQLPSEYLRVFSPSAEVRGHHHDRKLVPNKKTVTIDSIEPVGNYAIKLKFSDGHNTGIYTWEILYQLGKNYQSNWDDYLQKLQDNDLSR